jgi:hypothetical protein
LCCVSVSTQLAQERFLEVLGLNGIIIKLTLEILNSRVSAEVMVFVNMTTDHWGQ